MRVLIVESNPDLGELWQRHLHRQGAEVGRAAAEDDAIALLQQADWQVIVLDLVLDQGSAFAVADFASYRVPDAKVIFVTNTRFFSDGSIFGLCSNACAYIQSATPPEDLAAMVEHYGSTPPSPPP
ncbi:response regulator transcription factor [Rhodosalinus sp. K401]|uniref:response regulator transcription factor n=1 Tax=Rhodosalinus sp. K401 TaxID=3239195 RepID=UPI003523ACD8